MSLRKLWKKSTDEGITPRRIALVRCKPYFPMLEVRCIDKLYTTLLAQGLLDLETERNRVVDDCSSVGFS